MRQIRNSVLGREVRLIVTLVESIVSRSLPSALGSVVNLRINFPWRLPGIDVYNQKFPACHLKTSSQSFDLAEEYNSSVSGKNSRDAKGIDNPPS